MRLGEILIAEGLVLPAHVERVVAQQSRRPMRLGSLLVDAGLVTPDAVARALGRQRTTPAALERHLAGRDPSLATVIPADFARKHVVLPLARSRDGGVVIAMRDPNDAAVRAQLVRVIGTSVVAAVACELILRRHVEQAYPRLVADVEVEVEVDLGTRSIPVIMDDEDELGLDDIELGPPNDILDPATVRAQPAQLPRDFLDPDTLQGALISLDDVGAMRDPSAADTQVGPRRSGVVSALSGAVRPAMATPRRSSTGPEGRLSGTPRPTPTLTAAQTADLTTTLTQIATATSRDVVAAAVTEYGRGHVDGLLLLAVRQGMVFGDAGFAPDQTTAGIEAVSLPLNLPSVLKTAVDTARAYAGRPPVGSSIQDRLLKLLGKPAGLVVVPIAMSGRVVSVIVAGCRTVDDAAKAQAEAVTIAGACGLAYARLRS